MYDHDDVVLCFDVSLMFDFMFDVWCCDAYRTFDVWCFTFILWCLIMPWNLIWCFMFHVWCRGGAYAHCFMFYVWCSLFECLMLHVSFLFFDMIMIYDCFMFHVSRFMFHVSYFICLMFDVWYTWYWMNVWYMIDIGY